MLMFRIDRSISSDKKTVCTENIPHDTAVRSRQRTRLPSLKIFKVYFNQIENLFCFHNGMLRSITKSFV